ncbi:hypothetical protein B6V76_14180 [Thioclava sp. IC9]|nr:hypothetical protein B6V76_14180 [Thioclava sp. IC9]
MTKRTTLTRRAATAALAGVTLSALAACVPEPPDGRPSPLDGHWVGRYTPQSMRVMDRPCTPGYGGIFIRDGRVSGQATNTYGASYRVTGQVVGADRIVGNFYFRTRSVGSLKGHLVKGRLVGDYQNVDGCSGTWVATRQ